ncbi:TetR/AcrR family transcriptional regulator [Jatrophihabitans lederbergiae]|uniref:TetR/AcrR family transcriptional regulator n=1 Tax=Jatrophihabitans lederbergiae TaxID=3075547 RepID=A0ABU2J4L9_9ACTN|nr:TetR/AcrR family transcriptional regulator [Jatrophihabitans sp. DSM 44399]MDT0259930.1 TetR/AcrR family transcriptional regulator [Jatrophihabitans sp. DSM 44399]
MSVPRPELPGRLSTDVAAADRQLSTRERIVASALALFAEQGFDATSVNQIVVRAGVAKGALYHHFASKDDLLYEVSRELVDRQLDGMNAILADRQDTARTLRELIRDLVVTTAGSAPAAKVFSRESHRLGDANQARVRAARRSIHDTFTDLVRSAQHSGEFRAVTSPDMVTFTVFGFINELPVWYRADGPKTPVQIADELSELILSALMPAPGQLPAEGQP